MMLAAGDDSERLNAVIDLVDSSNSRGAKSIATMVDKIMGWGWIPATGQLESKELLTNTVCADSLRYTYTWQRAGAVRRPFQSRQIRAINGFL
jgi:hypothetical protein